MSVLFVFASCGGEEPVNNSDFDIKGTWKAVSSTNNDVVTIVDNEYMVFDEENAKDYRDAAAEPYISSKYTLNGTELNLSDISMKYTIEIKTNNYIRLCEDWGVYTDLIRYKNEDMSPVQVDKEMLSGKWNIVYRNAEDYAGDYLTFENNVISQFKASSSEPAATSSYEINANHLFVDKWGKELVLYPLTDDTVLMVELVSDSGYVWELQKDVQE